MSAYNPTGRITNIQRMCNHDGPGLRSTIFLKGCPLRCSWCHNPETMSRSCEIAWNKSRCIGCRECAAACGARALTAGAEGIHIDRELCRLCRRCVEECPTGALEWFGRDLTAEEAVRILVRDRAYYETSGGGITVSGGEPLMQPEFTGEILRLAKEEGICTALDTTCFAPWQVIEGLLPRTDLLLIDIKAFDSELHRKLTGVDNGLILNNIRRIAEYARAGEGPVIYIRTPLVPGCTVETDNIRRIGAFLKEHLEDVLEKWELLLFHNMCAAKYEALERPWAHRETPLIRREQAARIQEVVDCCGIDGEKITISGLAAGWFLA